MWWLKHTPFGAPVVSEENGSMANSLVVSKGGLESAGFGERYLENGRKFPPYLCKSFSPLASASITRIVSNPSYSFLVSLTCYTSYFFFVIMKNCILN